MSPATRVVCLVGCLLSLVAVGCADREHIRDDYGEHVRTHFAKQRVYQEPAEGSPSGLDSEEAAVVHENYRTQLGGGKAAQTPASSQVLVLDESQRGK